MNILYATTNTAKFSEAKTNFAEHGFDIVSPLDLDIDLDINETGSSIEENATLKAEAYLTHVPPGTIIIGDDTGIFIDALGGEPGIHARRWKGYKMSDTEIMDYCLSRMEGIPQASRGVEFRIALAVASSQRPTQVFVGTFRTHLRTIPLPLREAGFPFRPLITDDHPTHRLTAIKQVVPYLSTLQYANH